MEDIKIKNPVELSKNICNEFSEYIKSTFQIRNPELNELFHMRLEELGHNLYKGPYLCSYLPFKSAKSINDYVNEGLLCKEFLELGNLNITRPLYKHQKLAIDKIENGRNVVITTGTGSGKTECFLYPIIDKILKDMKETGDKKGIRAILLFPMNALINDQVNRLRELLANHKDITYGFFNGNSPKDSNDRKAINKYKKRLGDKTPTNELITREEMVKNPPSILFTNYSMLEYLLIRPDYANLLNEQTLKNWRFMILDEAHSYKGALGIELSMLLRRLVGTSGHENQRFILTSATLGTGVEAIPDIISFAKNLTSKDYEEGDVIFAERDMFNSEERFKNNINPDIYRDLFLAISNGKSIDEIMSPYKECIDENEKVTIYNFLIKDNRVYELYSLTKQAENFYDVFNYLYSKDNRLTIESFVDFIELISMAQNKEEKCLYNIKYHLFVKAPDGAFITLGKRKDLSLTTCKYINDKKAFKIGICQNCGTPYLVGKIVDGILEIDDNIDMDAELNEEDDTLKYFLIKSVLTESEIEDIESNKDNYIKYSLCTKCGRLKEIDNLMSEDCEHEECEKEIVYLINESKNNVSSSVEDRYMNNLHKCAICDFKTKTGGVVLGFHIGKDRATSLLSQILYENMDPIYKKQEIDDGDFFGGPTVEFVPQPKQFLTFSDSRQAAATFNKFIDYTNKKMLKYAAVWDALKKNNFEPIKYNDLVNTLCDTYRHLGFDDEESEQYAKSAILWELLNVDGRNSGEGRGLYLFSLDLPYIFFKDDHIEQSLKKKGFNNISASQFRTLIAVILNVFRTVPAIDYGLHVDDANKREELLSYRQFINFVSEKNDAKDKKVYALFPENSAHPNKPLKYIMKTFGYDLPKAIELLHLVFNICKNKQCELMTSYGDKYRINANKYTLYPYTKVKYYQCKKCKNLTIHNINNKCPVNDCDGELIECDPDDVLSWSYYRKEYMTRPIENIVSAEHTGQISAEKGSQIQADFVAGKINILNSTTTFEMGINIGKLNTVFMRNVPPTPANYVQRAGRAGREAGSSAFILTFCSISSHDFNYFSDPAAMIDGRINPPKFDTDNEKIISRHISATALTYFFKLYPESFENLEVFINNKYDEKFQEYIKTKPQDLGNFIDKYLLKTKESLDMYGNFKWVEYLKEESKQPIAELVKRLKDEIEEIKKAIDFLKKDEEVNDDHHNYRLIKQYQAKLKTTTDSTSIINYFARFGIIPRYGFPIDTVPLKVFNLYKNEFDDDYNLERDLSVAVSDYAPDSEVIVEGKKYTSRYVFTPHPYALPPIYFYVECPVCHSYNVKNTEEAFRDPNCKCEYCNKPLNANGKNIKRFIEPVRGFVTAPRNKLSRTIAPVKTYSGDIKYIGHGKDLDGEPLDVGSTIKVSKYKNEELLVLNDNNFFWCPDCGYTILKKKKYDPYLEEPHKDYRGIDCSNKKLEKINFGHMYITDILKLDFKGIDEMLDYDHALSVLYAILEGMSNLFQIERTDINGVVFRPRTDGPYSLILFDTVAGGAGHVKRIDSPISLLAILKSALDVVNRDCCSEDTSCYNCIRNFNNQRVHSHLKRGFARDKIFKCINQIENNLYHKFDIITISQRLSSLKEAIDNCVFNEAEKAVLSELESLSHGFKIYQPTGYGLVLKNNDGKKAQAALYWEKPKVLVFKSNKYSDYLTMVNNQSIYKCFLINENFDVFSLLNAIKVGN